MRKQSTFALIAVLFATFFLMVPGLALAVGLGPIQSNTHIGQNLRARIPIRAANPGVLQGLTVGLAKPDAYRRADIHESDFLFSLKFKVKQGANGPYVLVTSTRPVRMPFLDILVHAQWSSGAVTRQYTLLLDPPVFASARPEQAQAPAPVAVPTAPQRQTPIARPKPSPSRLEPPSKPSYMVQKPAPAQAARPGVYGPIQRGATLWGIADNVRSGASVNQMMIAIYHANPQAFAGNIDRLKAGVTLRIPSRAEVARISRAEANAEVAKQVRSWKAAKAGAKSEVAKTGTLADPSVNRAGGSGKPAAGVAGHTAFAASASPQAGEVVLTAPKVTQSVAAGGGAAASVKSVGGAGKPAGARAAATLVAAAGARPVGATRGKGGGSAQAAAVPAASAGGPAKVHNAELANLAAAGQAAAKPAKPAENTSRAATHKAHKAKSSARTYAVDGTAKGGGLSATVWDWLTSPKGWIVIALIVLVLILIIFLLVRRRHRHERNLMALAASASAVDAPLQEREEPALGSSDTAVAVDENAVAALAAEPAAPHHSEAEAREESGTESHEEAARPDALAEADLYASHGDYAGAARVLSEALEAAPERNDLRLRLLELQFAVDDGPAFRDAAEELHGRVLETGSEWRSAAVMGRELLPDDPMFAEDETGEQTLESALAGDQETNRETEPTDFDFELDQLDEEEPAETGEPDEFERTLGELSTMIETYMPESDEGPVELHLPPEETGSFALAEEESLTLAELSDAGAEESREGAEGASRLELAQAYLDMEDRESARATLEGLLADGDEAQREQAQRMLDTMAGESAEGLPAEYGETLEWTEESLPADEEPFEADDSGTAMDLARAYLELGDRESARDILEEILDDGSEPQREKARELLETLS